MRRYAALEVFQSVLNVYLNHTIIVLAKHLASATSKGKLLVPTALAMFCLSWIHDLAMQGYVVSYLPMYKARGAATCSN